tara:strand:- start:182 stop:610 length:429 start_codon:yes stop_codon:yes gene_type:complete
MKKASELRDNEVLIVSCNTIDKRFSEYYIKTTHKEIMDTITEYNDKLEKDKDEKWCKIKNEGHNLIGIHFRKLSHRKIIEAQFNEISKNINQYSDKELNDLYEKKNQLWTDWCNDCILYYCCNRVLNNIMIPTITLFDSKNY